MRKIRVVAFLCEGRYQSYLLDVLASRFDLVGVVLQVGAGVPAVSLQTRLAPYVKSPLRLVRHVLARLLLPVFERAARSRIDSLFSDFSRRSVDDEVPALRVSSIRDEGIAAFVDRVAPDVAVVNGTQLIREPLLSQISRLPFGAINLHTGLSPYSRGGNCNLFMLLEGRPELVGVTVHHLDSGIDSGSIVTTAQVSIHANDDNFELVDAKSFKLGIDLVAQVLSLMQAGVALPRVPQWCEGKLFLRRTGYVYEPWHRLRANLRLKFRASSSSAADASEARDEIRTVKLP